MSTSKAETLEAELAKDFPLRETGDPQHRILYLTEALRRYKELAGVAPAQPKEPAKVEPASSGTKVYRR